MPRFNGRGSNQADRILRLLLEANGQRVPAPALSRIALQFSARLNQLRADGWVIENEMTPVQGKRHSAYWLAGRREAANMQDNPSPRASSPTVPMFSSPLVRRMD